MPSRGPTADGTYAHAFLPQSHSIPYDLLSYASTHADRTCDRSSAPTAATRGIPTARTPPHSVLAATLHRCRRRERATAVPWIKNRHRADQPRRRQAVRSRRRSDTGGTASLLLRASVRQVGEHDPGGRNGCGKQVALIGVRECLRHGGWFDVCQVNSEEVSVADH